MPTAPAPTRRPVPRPFLERVSRALLCRLATRHEAALAAHPELSLAALAATAQIDRAQVDVLWRLLSTPTAALAPFHDELLALADVATPGGHEALLGHDTAHALDRELGAEDCAAVAFLEHRALFDKARPHSASPQTRSFASFQPGTPRPLPTDPAHAAAFARQMSEVLEARGRTRHFKVHEWHSGIEHHFEMVYGRLAQSRDLLGKVAASMGHDVTAQVTDRSTERAHAVFLNDVLRLDVAGPEWVKELVRRLFGAAYFGAEDHFAGDETMTLAPLLDLATALSAEGIPDVEKVDLQELGVDLGDGSGWITIGARSDVLKGAAGRYVERGLRDGVSCQATFLLKTTFRTRPVKLILVTPRKLDFDRRDPRVVRLVRDWVVARGYMQVPAHLRPTEHAETSAERGDA